MLSQLLKVLLHPPDESLKMILLEAHEQHPSKERSYNLHKTKIWRNKLQTNFCISQRPPTVLITQRESTKNRQKHLCFYQLHLNKRSNLPYPQLRRKTFANCEENKVGKKTNWTVARNVEMFDIKVKKQKNKHRCCYRKNIRARNGIQRNLWQYVKENTEENSR